MRSTRLISIALQAEKLRLQRFLSNCFSRIILAGSAIVLLLLAVFFLHVAVYGALRLKVDPPWAALIVSAIDIIAAIGVGAFAMRSPTDIISQDAIKVRNDALSAVRGNLVFGTALVPIVKTLMKLRR